MEKAKVIYVCNNPRILEDRINEFLATGVKVTRVVQAASGRMDHHVTVIIFYTE